MPRVMQYLERFMIYQNMHFFHAIMQTYVIATIVLSRWLLQKQCLMMFKDGKGVEKMSSYDQKWVFDPMNWLNSAFPRVDYFCWYWTSALQFLLKKANVLRNNFVAW